jgi:hypothetical protein
MKKRFFALTLILMTAVSVAVFAQRGRCPQGFQSGYGQGPGPNPEMRAYFEENVLPVLISEREALAKQISQADKLRLDEIRTEMKSMRAVMRSKRQAMRESDERPSMEQRREMREHRNKMHNYMDEVAEMSFKYDAEISAALDVLREQADTWRNDQRKWRKENNQQMRNCPGNMRGQGKRSFGGRGKGQGHGMGFHRMLTPEGFLLFDTDNPLQFADEGGMLTEDSSISLFPNPADASVQLSASLDETSDVIIEVIDKSGQVVLTKTSSNATEGIFTETLNLEDLDTGIYFVKFKAGEFTKIEQLIIRK